MKMFIPKENLSGLINDIEVIYSFSMKIIFLFLILFFFSFHLLFAQKQDSIAKNSITVNVTTFFNSQSINYERIIINQASAKISLNAGFANWQRVYRIDVGGSSTDIRLQNGPFLSMGIITGSRNHHFEICGGVKYALQNDISPLYNIAYKYQKPRGGFILRFFIGNYGLFGIGCGYSF